MSLSNTNKDETANQSIKYSIKYVDVTSSSYSSIEFPASQEIPIYIVEKPYSS